MVITLLLPMSYAFKWGDYVNMWHFEHLAKMCLLTSGILTYSYGCEYFIGWYSQNPYEWGIFYWRATGEYAWAFWIMVFCNCIAPLAWYYRPARTNPWTLFIVSIFVNIGMWFERFNIVISSLAHQFDPASHTYYRITPIELGIMIGSFGWFGFWFLLFLQTLPAVAIAEIKEMIAPPVRGSALVEAAK